MKILKGKKFEELYEERIFEFWIQLFKHYTFTENFYNYFFLRNDIVNINFIRYLIQKHPEIYFNLRESEKESAIYYGKFTLKDFDTWENLDPNIRELENILEIYSLSPQLSVKDVEKNPHILWNYRNLSSNEKITTSFIMRNLDKNWNWNILSKRKDINWVLLFKHLLKNKNFINNFLGSLSWRDLLKNNFINKNFIISHRNLPWPFGFLEESYKLSVEEIVKIKCCRTDFYKLSSRCDFTKNHILTYNKEFLNWEFLSTRIEDISFVFRNINFPWRWDKLSISLDIKHIKKYEELPWDFRNVTYNKSLQENKNSISFIKNFKCKNWDWEFIARNYIITKQDVFNTEELNCLPYCIACNKSFSVEELVEIFLSFSDLNFLRNVNYLNYSPNLTIDFVFKNPQFNWNFHKLSSHKDLKLEDVLGNINKGWNWNVIGTRFSKEITVEELKKFPTMYLPVHPNMLEFKEEKNKILKDISIIKSSVRIIERAWYRCTWDPSYKMCSKLFFKRCESDGFVFSD